MKGRVYLLIFCPHSLDKKGYKVKCLQFIQLYQLQLWAWNLAVETRVGSTPSKTSFLYFQIQDNAFAKQIQSPDCNGQQIDLKRCRLNQMRMQQTSGSSLQSIAAWGMVATAAYLMNCTANTTRSSGISLCSLPMKAWFTLSFCWSACIPDF